MASPDTSFAQSESSDACTATGNKIRIAKRNYATTCPTLPREDCDPLSNGGWICSSENITGVTANPVDPDPVVDPDVPTPNDGQVGMVSVNDLVALHYDNCPDRDYGHAVVAG